MDNSRDKADFMLTSRLRTGFSYFLVHVESFFLLLLQAAGGSARVIHCISYAAFHTHENTYKYTHLQCHQTTRLSTKVTLPAIFGGQCTPARLQRYRLGNLYTPIRYPRNHPPIELATRERIRRRAHLALCPCRVCLWVAACSSKLALVVAAFTKWAMRPPGLADAAELALRRA